MTCDMVYGREDPLGKCSFEGGPKQRAVSCGPKRGNQGHVWKLPEVRRQVNSDSTLTCAKEAWGLR